MKTFESEKGNIPEGAAHYQDECNDRALMWIKSLNGSFEVLTDGYDDFVPANWLASDICQSPIKPIPQAKEVEWVNGLPPVGVKCVFVGIHNNHHCNVSIYHSDDNKIMFLGRVDGFPKESTIENFKDELDLMVFYCRDGDKPFIPLESEAERKERKELEAAYDLLRVGNRALNVTAPCTFDEFKLDKPQCDFWLAIIRKTNYKVKGE